MSSCCNGPQNRKVKEWGNEAKKNKSAINIKVILGVALVLLAAFIVTR